ncbi:MAG: hypothetical protein OXT67_12980 [Zetaproteobacteria bacterium]|nr:hypothetical protein [Zetaproteobacteria bacterium]
MNCLHLLLKWLLLSLFGLSLSVNSPCLFAVSLKRVAGIPIHLPPSVEKWRWFQRQPPAWHQRLWLYVEKKGVKWEDWHWQWKIAWLNACRDRRWQGCRKLLGWALNDRAKFIATNAVTLVPYHWKPTESSRILRALLKRSTLLGQERPAPGLQMLVAKIRQSLASM